VVRIDAGERTPGNSRTHLQGCCRQTLTRRLLAVETVCTVSVWGCGDQTGILETEGEMSPVFAGWTAALLLAALVAPAATEPNALATDT
jgi:hypothetical protein